MLSAFRYLPCDPNTLPDCYCPWRELGTKWVEFTVAKDLGVTFAPQRWRLLEGFDYLPRLVPSNIHTFAHTYTYWPAENFLASCLNILSRSMVYNIALLLRMADSSFLSSFRVLGCSPHTNSHMQQQEILASLPLPPREGSSLLHLLTWGPWLSFLLAFSAGCVRSPWTSPLCPVLSPNSPLR